MNGKNKKKYDIGLICVFNPNYGNNITNYALYNFFENEGYNVLMIKQPLTCFWTDKINGDFGLFRNNPFENEEVDMMRDKIFHYYNLNEKCSAFVLGSDQLWSYGFVAGTDYYTTANWTVTSIPRIAYGTSFGTDSYDGSFTDIQLLGDYVKRFNRIFLREESGVEYLKRTFNVSSQHVCDPIFFLSSQEYEKKFKLNVSSNNEKMIGAYILDYSSATNEAICTASEELNCSNVMLIGNPIDNSAAGWDPAINCVKNAKVEDLVELIDRCDYFITDSYHGMCLALIFHKQFQVFAKRNSKRGFSRIYSLLKKLDSLERMIESDDVEETRKMISIKLDYDRIDYVLGTWVNECKNILLQAINSAGIIEDSYYDNRLKEYCNKMELDEKNKVKQVRENWKEYCSNNGIDASLIPVIWGCGDRFREYAFLFKMALGVQVVVDSNNSLWNEKIYDSFICISPDEIVKDSVVIVLIDNTNVVESIARKSIEAGIKNIAHYRLFVENV